jgi:SAM-dependent methyltransferase
MHDDRLQRERAFHDRRFGTDNRVRESAGKYYSIGGKAVAEYRRLVARYCHSKNLLEYGCGQGGFSFDWLSLGAAVTGIDISPEAVKEARRRAFERGYEANYYVRNAEETDFDDNHFDLVVGTSILHHLDVGNAYAEVSRILKPDGHAIFLEPLGHNPLINLYRRLTPSMRSEDEHPLKHRDIQLSKRFFSKVETSYYNLSTILAVPFRNEESFGYTNKLLQSLDNLLFCLPLVKRYAWMIVLHISEPKK